MKCRHKKLQKFEQLQMHVKNLEFLNMELKEEDEQLSKDLVMLQEKYLVLYNEIFFLLRDEDGQELDPSLYEICHSENGNVFLSQRRE